MTFDEARRWQNLTRDQFMRIMAELGVDNPYTVIEVRVRPHEAVIERTTLPKEASDGKG